MRIVALFREPGWSGEWPTGGHGPGLRKNPGVPNGSPGHGDAVDARFRNHPETIGRREQVTTAEEGPLSHPLFDFREKFPAAGTDVPLFDSTTMNGDCRDPVFEGSVQDSKKVVAAVIGVIDPAAHFQSDRYLGGHILPSLANDLDCNVGLPQVKSPPAAAEDFPDRAPKIDIDDIEPGFDQLHGSGGELGRFGTHQLPAHRMFFVGDMQEMAGSLAVLHLDQEFVEHHFADRVGGSMTSGDDPHRAVAVTGEGGLDDRKADGHVSQLERPQLGIAGAEEVPGQTSQGAAEGAESGSEVRHRFSLKSHLP